MRREDLSNPSLQIEYDEDAREDLNSGYEFMSSIPGARADRWLDGVVNAIRKEAEQQATLPIGRARFSSSPPNRPLVYIQYRTPGGSPWHIAFELTDETGQGKPDTLRVIAVKHAQANPA